MYLYVYAHVHVYGRVIHMYVHTRIIYTSGRAEGATRNAEA